MAFRGKKQKGEPEVVTEEMLLSTLADVRSRQREAEIEKMQKENELKSLQKQAKETINSERRFKRLTRNCARTEMLAESWDSVIDIADDAAFVFERLRTLLKSGNIQGDINESLDQVKLRNPEVALTLDKFRENLNQLSITSMAQLEQINQHSEAQAVEPELEEKAKGWEVRLLKESETKGEKILKESDTKEEVPPIISKDEKQTSQFPQGKSTNKKELE